MLSKAKEIEKKCNETLRQINKTSGKYKRCLLSNGNPNDPCRLEMYKSVYRRCPVALFMQLREKGSP